ncbi:MAG: esterase YqiA [Colwellia sp.]|nr:esterase YqiA [Colwellia sp.]
MQKNILYIHGFNSSALAIKAKEAEQYFHENLPEVNFVCPQLATSPRAAIEQLENIDQQTETNQQGTYQQGTHNAWSFIGSSLGGYFAAYLAEKYQAQAVLVNPAVKPFELLKDYIGEQKNPYTNIVYQVTDQQIIDLKALEQSAPNFDDKQKNNYLVMVQTGDEVLDYQQAVEKYQHCRLIVEEGGDHSFEGFDKKLPMIADFLNNS